MVAAEKAFAERDANTEKVITANLVNLEIKVKEATIRTEAMKIEMVLDSAEYDGDTEAMNGEDKRYKCLNTDWNLFSQELCPWQMEEMAIYNCSVQLRSKSVRGQMSLPWKGRR